MIIPSRNTLANQSWIPKTYLTHTESAGTNILRWSNPNGFSASWAVQVGETGEEQTEVVLLGASTPSGTAGTLTANTLYEHPADTPLYGVKYNQVVFERSTAGTTGTASPITDGTITYQADKNVTIFDDTSGSSSYGYRTYFRNSVLAVNSTESDWITSAGFSFYALASIRQRIKNKLWDASYIKDDSRIDEWINEWKDVMQNEVIAVNEDYALGTIEVAFDSNGYGTITTADFSQVRRMWITYDGVGTYQATKMNVNDYVPGQVFLTTRPHFHWEGDTVFKVLPDESGGTAQLEIYRFGTTMVNDTDTLPQTIRPFTKSFVDYGVAQAAFLDEKLDLYDRKIAEANIEKGQFVNKLVPRDKTGPQMIDLVESVSGFDHLP